MSHPELDGGFEFVADEDIRRLFNKTTDWLKLNGGRDPSSGLEIYGEINGITIANQSPDYSYILPVETARLVAPHAVVSLNLGGPFEITYLDRCYQKSRLGENIHLSEPPMCRYKITQPQDSHLDFKSIWIMETEDGSLIVDRAEELRVPMRQSLSGHVEEDFIQLGARLELETEVGINRLTRNETEAIEELIDCIVRQAS